MQSFLLGGSGLSSKSKVGYGDVGSINRVAFVADGAGQADGAGGHSGEDGVERPPARVGAGEGPGEAPRGRQGHERLVHVPGVVPAEFPEGHVPDRVNRAHPARPDPAHSHHVVADAGQW